MDKPPCRNSVSACPGDILQNGDKLIYMTARCLKIALASFFLAFPACIHAYAQRMNCAGIVQSYTRMGLYYQRETRDGSFMSWSLCAETAEMFSGRLPFPGMSVSFGWNFILAEAERPCGNRLIFFAGPGVAAGLCNDYKSPPGFLFGLQGRAGISLRCARNVDITANVAPVIGLHSTVADETIYTKYYKYGLMRALIPEIRIGYRF